MLFQGPAAKARISPEAGMAKNKFADVDPAVLAAYMKMIEGVEGVEARGAAAPYTSLNGNMYSSISKFNEIGLRLAKDEREAFLEKYHV